MECKDCKFYEPIGDSGGKCHRFPPNQDGQGTATTDEFPVVRPDFWCGEHKWLDVISAKKG